MIRRHARILRALLMASDAFVAAAVLIGVASLMPDQARLVGYGWALVGLFAGAWVVLLYFEGEYRLRARWTLRSEIGGVARAMVLLAVLSPPVLYLTGVIRMDRVLPLVGLFPILFLATVATRAVLRWSFEWYRARGNNGRMQLILGTGPHAVRFAHQMEERRSLGIRVIGFVGDEPPATLEPWPWLGPVDQVLDVLHSQVVDEVAVCLPVSEWPDAQEVIELCTAEGKIVRFPLDVPRAGPELRIIEDLEGTPILSLVQRPDQALALAAKRAFDVVVAAVLLLVLSPLLLGLALYIRHKGGSPVLYRQTRVGMHGRQFTMLKFRTMTPDADDRYDEVAGQADARGFKLADDPRVTSWGAWLRRSSLDELPQLVNVLRGDMSIVGPRPAPPREVENYDLWHRRRLSMKPGITGLWQVGPRFDRDFNERARLDLDYIDRWSLWLDLRIVARTLPAVLHLTGR
jgi:exopolysaccharide biosynthesis polyprenyl glycosylphosphotransferase